MTLRAKYWKLYQNFSPGAYALSFAALQFSVAVCVSAPAGARDQTNIVSPSHIDISKNSVPFEIPVNIASPGDTIFSLCRQRTISFGTFGGSESWGYTAPGDIDYAIMGIHNGIAFVNATTGEIADIVPAPTNNCGQIRWRNMVTSGQYCYAVSLCTGTNQGIMVMDMSFCPTVSIWSEPFPHPSSIHSLQYSQKLIARADFCMSRVRRWLAGAFIFMIFPFRQIPHMSAALHPPPDMICSWKTTQLI